MNNGKIYEIKAGHSDIDRTGCFAEEDMPAGVVVIVCRLSEHSAWRKLNHQCKNPNLKYIEGLVKPSRFISLREIKKGEELTFNYRDYSPLYYDWVMERGCRCPDCRANKGK